MEPNYINEKDVGLNFYNDRILIAQRYGYDCIVDCIEDLYVNKKATLQEIANIFDYSYTGICKLVGIKIRGGYQKHGGRRIRPNKHGIFKIIKKIDGVKSTIRVIAGIVNKNGMEFERVRCGRCHLFMPDLTYSRFEILKWGEEHVCERRINPTGFMYNHENKRKIYISAEIVNIKEKQYEKIRCIKCNTIIKDKIRFKNIWHVFKNHVCGEYNENTVLGKELL